MKYRRCRYIVVVFLVLGVIKFAIDIVAVVESQSINRKRISRIGYEPAFSQLIAFYTLTIEFLRLKLHLLLMRTKRVSIYRKRI